MVTQVSLRGNRTAVPLADDVRQALGHYHSGRETVGGISFPGVGRHPDDQIQRLETAIASLAAALRLIAERVDELEGRRGE